MAGRWFFLLLGFTFVYQCSALTEHQGTLDVEESLRFRRSTNKKDENKRRFTSAEKQFLVDEHNEYRRGQGASDMLYMTWEKELEDIAQGHAEKCVWVHNKDRLIQSTGKKAGENMHLITSSYNENRTMTSWYSEEDYYTYTDNSCQAGKACGHYTQIVWAKSEAVGCGIRFCESVDGVSYKDVYLTICNYRPAGNSVGIKPYTKGTACSRCPAGKQKCDDGLCQDGSGEVTTKKPATTTKKPVTTKPPTTTRTSETTTRAANDVTTNQTSAAACMFSFMTMPVTWLIVGVAISCCS